MSAEGVSRRMSAQGVSAYGVCVQRGYLPGRCLLRRGNRDGSHFLSNKSMLMRVMAFTLSYFFLEYFPDIK